MAKKVQKPDPPAPDTSQPDPDPDSKLTTKTKTTTNADKNSAAAASVPSSSKASTSRSSLLLVLSFLAVGLAVGYHQVTTNQVQLPTQLTSAWRSLTATVSAATGGKPVSKYETDLVLVEPRVLLTSTHCRGEGEHAYAPELLMNGRIVHVTDAMEGPTLRDDKLFFMLNGRNEGVYVTWNGEFQCLALAARKAALWLGADPEEIENGVRLYTQMGFPIRTKEELSSTKHLVHILLDFQIWQWPGIKKGYQYVLEDGVTLTTVGLTPKVLDVKYFLTADEANEIIDRGVEKLNRSKVDGANSSTVVSKSRTSHTAFLPDSEFTRDFRRRSARVARLPGASFVERLQLVRYAAGEFYRQHLDTFHSREFLPKEVTEYSMEDYKTWATWAAARLRELDPEMNSLPEEFREGSGALFPDPEDTVRFPNALLSVFYEHAMASNYFESEFDMPWEQWVRNNLAKNASNMIPGVMKPSGKPHYLPVIVHAWEKKLGRGDAHYAFHKPGPGEVNGVTHYFRWVRWAKERITFLGDKAPTSAQPAGALFPKYTVAFQRKLLKFVLDDFSQSFVTQVTDEEWYEWMKTNRKSNHVLFKAMQLFPGLAELAIRAWEARVGIEDSSASLRYTMPHYARHFHPQRFVTLFLYLNNETKVGGETVFPFSLERFSDDVIERTGMDECSTGLAVPPRGLHASLFYVQTPEGEVDRMSRHGGCPPHEGVKWGSNSFMWDADADEGADLWTTK